MVLIVRSIAASSAIALALSCAPVGADKAVPRFGSLPPDPRSGLGAASAPESDSPFARDSDFLELSENESRSVSEPPILQLTSLPSPDLKERRFLSSATFAEFRLIRVSYAPDDWDPRSDSKQALLEVGGLVFQQYFDAGQSGEADALSTEGSGTERVGKRMVRGTEADVIRYPAAFHPPDPDTKMELHAISWQESTPKGPAQYALWGYHPPDTLHRSAASAQPVR